MTCFQVDTASDGLSSVSEGDLSEGAAELSEDWDPIPVWSMVLVYLYLHGAGIYLYIYIYICRL